MTKLESNVMKYPILLNVTRKFSKKTPKKKSPFSHTQTKKKTFSLSPIHRPQQLTGPASYSPDPSRPPSCHSVQPTAARCGAPRRARWSRRQCAARCRSHANVRPGGRQASEIMGNKWPLRKWGKKIRGTQKTMGGEPFLDVCFIGMIIQPKHKKMLTLRWFLRFESCSFQWVKLDPDSPIYCKRRVPWLLRQVRWRSTFTFSAFSCGKYKFWVFQAFPATRVYQHSWK